LPRLFFRYPQFLESGKSRPDPFPLLPDVHPNPTPDPPGHHFHRFIHVRNGVIPFLNHYVYNIPKERQEGILWRSKSERADRVGNSEKLYGKSGKEASKNKLDKYIINSYT
jgi:hypothetical protein